MVLTRMIVQSHLSLAGSRFDAGRAGFVVKALGQRQLFLKRFGGQLAGIGRIKAEQVPPLTLEALLTDVPPIVVVLLNRKQRTNGRLVTELVALGDAHLVEHATVIEEDAPAAGHAHQLLAAPLAPAQEAATHCHPSGVRPHVRQEFGQVFRDPRDLVGIYGRPTLAAAYAVAAAAKRAFKRRAVQIEDGEVEFHGAFFFAHVDGSRYYALPARLLQAPLTRAAAWRTKRVSSSLRSMPAAASATAKHAVGFIS